MYKVNLTISNDHKTMQNKINTKKKATKNGKKTSSHIFVHS